MTDPRQSRGYSIIEVMIVVSIMSVLALAGGTVISTWNATQRTKEAARSMADLAIVARGQAIRTGVPHLLFFGSDALGANLLTPDGIQVAALVARDVDGDGIYDPGEFVSSSPMDLSGTLFWGVTNATVPAPADLNPNQSLPPPTPWTFTTPGGGSASWTVFMPDGTPRGFTVGPFSAGNIGTGEGAVYVTSIERDYAMVLTPLGGVRVHGWDLSQTPPAWSQ